MSQARVHYVKHARQTFAKVPKTDEAGERVVTTLTRKDGSAKVGRSGRAVVRRINVNDKERPLPLKKCGKCGTEIQLGDPYRWFTVGFRSHHASVRCMKGSCTPTRSQLESSALGDVYAAIDEADYSPLDNVSTLEEAEDAAREILDGVTEALDDVASTYREADDQFGGGGATDSGERADMLESASGELGSFGLSAGDPDACEAHEEDPGEPQADCEDCQTLLEEWRGNVQDEVRDAINDVELP